MKKIRICAVLLIVFVTKVTTSSALEKKILFVLSAANELTLQGGKKYSGTGVFLSEMYVSLKSIESSGYSIEFATPNGVKASIDKESYNLKYWRDNEMLQKEALSFVDNDIRFNNPKTLEFALTNFDGYSGLVIPGGQGLMVDLKEDSIVKELIKAFASKDKCVGLICHAPALLLSIPTRENPYKGYQVNSVTRMEELFIEKFVMKGKPQSRKIGKQLKNKGFHYRNKGPAKNFAVKDRRLVTSQNPFSDRAFTQKYLLALKEYENR